MGWMKSYRGNLISETCFSRHASKKNVIFLNSAHTWGEWNLTGEIWYRRHAFQKSVIFLKLAHTWGQWNITRRKKLTMPTLTIILLTFLDKIVRECWNLMNKCLYLRHHSIDRSSRIQEFRMLWKKQLSAYLPFVNQRDDCHFIWHYWYSIHFSLSQIANDIDNDTWITLREINIFCPKLIFTLK